MTRVSVIIPAYNVSGYIVRSLGSVLNQNYPDIEVVIVNDGSTDNLEAVLQRYLSDKRIKYISTENWGVSHALNVGLKSATGDYIAFLHADDIFRPGKIEEQLSLLGRFPGFYVSYTDENYFLEGSENGTKSPYFHFSGDIFYFLKRNNFIHMSTVMMRRELIGDVMFDEKLPCHEDWDVFLKLSRRGVKFLYIDEILSDISLGPRNLSRDKDLMNSTRREVGERARFLWKEFKKEINIYSIEGISSLKRYALFKTRALLSGFPSRKKFHAKSPRELLENLP